MQKRARTAQAKQDRANAILDKARQMLLTTGYDRIKMADLAGALGLSSGTLYVYFQNKETLFLHLLRREFEQRMEHLEQEAAARDLSDFAGVRDLLLEALSYLLQDQLLYVYLETLRAQMLACGGDSARWMRSRLDRMLERLAERSVLSVPQLQELITADAGRTDGIGKQSTELDCSFLKDIVAAGMAEAIVDPFEIVKIQNKQEGLRVCTRGGQMRFHPAPECGSIHQPCQGVFLNQLLELLVHLVDFLVLADCHHCVPETGHRDGHGNDGGNGQVDESAAAQEPACQPHEQAVGQAIGNDAVGNRHLNED